MTHPGNRNQDRNRSHPDHPAAAPIPADRPPRDGDPRSRQPDRQPGGGYRGQQGGYDSTPGYGSPPGAQAGSLGERHDEHRHGAIDPDRGTSSGPARFSDSRGNRSGLQRSGDRDAAHPIAPGAGTRPASVPAHSRASADAAWPGEGPGSSPVSGRAAIDHQQQHDPDYRQWRDEQLRSMDAEYDAWRNERYRKFSDEFGEWRKKRQDASSSGASGSSSGTSAASIGTGTGGAASPGTSGGDE